MDILLVAKPWRHGLANYLYRALTELFPASVRWFSTRPTSLKERVRYKLDRATWRHELVQKINKTDYDAAIFINYFQELKYLSKKNHVIWLTDNPCRNDSAFRAFRRIFISDPGYLEEMRTRLRNRSNEVSVLGFACDPNIHRRLDGLAGKLGMCFIANRDPKRDYYLKALIDAGHDIKIYGNYFGQTALYWRRPTSFFPKVRNERMGAVYAKYQASLNIHAQVVRGGTNMRTFECAAYGIPQLVEYRDGLEEYFEPDKEILVFQNTEEMLEKHNSLLGDISLQRRLAEGAQRSCLQKHTYRHRALTMLEGIVPKCNGPTP